MSITAPEIEAFVKVWGILQNWQYEGARLEVVKAADSEGVTFESAVHDYTGGYTVETNKVPWAEILERE